MEAISIVASISTCFYSKPIVVITFKITFLCDIGFESKYVYV